MKRVILTLIFFVVGQLYISAQKIAVVNTKYILENIAEYNAAQNQLDELAVEWQKEIEAKFAEIDRLYKAYQAEQILLPEDVKQKRQDEIIKKEKEAKDLQKQRFGKDGDLFKKRQELVKPIQDKVYNAINEIATKGNYQLVIDKSADLVLLYVNPKIDISDQVLEAMGYTPGGHKKKETEKD